MVIPIFCDKCEGNEFNVDTDKLAWPFTSDMFPVGVDCIHSRTWTFPPGPVNMELTCPGCGGFPFEFRDGIPTGKLKVRDSADSRFLKLVDWEEIKTEPMEFVDNHQKSKRTYSPEGLERLEVIERLEASEFKPVLSMSKRFRFAKPNDPWTGTKCGCTKKRKDFFDADMGWCKLCRREKLKKR